MSESWEEITVNKPRSPDMSMLGKQARPHGPLGHDSRPMPMPSATALKESAHVHVKVDGLAGKLCILNGQDPEAVIAEARELAGGG